MRLPQTIYLPGPSIHGLYGMFETNYGDPSTPKPYGRVTPSRYGKTILPFHCVRCRFVIDFGNPEHAADYCDRRNATKPNYFCPSCGYRFFLDYLGPQYTKPLRKDGTAPARLRRLRAHKDGSIIVGVDRRYDTLSETPMKITDHLSSSSYILGCCVLAGDVCPTPTEILGEMGRRVRLPREATRRLAPTPQGTELFRQPRYVVVSPKNSPKSATFGAAVGGGIAARYVSVRGGKRSVPPFAKDSVYFENPERVIVTQNDGRQVTFTDTEFLQVYGVL